MIDNPFPCDIGDFVTIQETILRLRTIGLISTLALDGGLKGDSPGDFWVLGSYASKASSYH